MVDLQVTFCGYILLLKDIALGLENLINGCTISVSIYDFRLCGFFSVVDGFSKGGFV